MPKQKQTSAASGKKSKKGEKTRPKSKQTRADPPASLINYLQTEFTPGEFYDPNFQRWAKAAATSGSDAVTMSDKDIFEAEALWVNNFGGGMDFDLVGMGGQFATNAIDGRHA